MAGDRSAQDNFGVISDDEWEYEYDYDSTESFFVTLEFALDNSVYPPGGRHQNSEKWAAKANQEASTPSNAQDTVVPASEASFADEDGGMEQDTSIKAGAHEKLQILDIAGTNPLISRNGRTFSAAWGRTIGTNMVLSASGAVEKGIEPVLRTDGFDLVSLSRLKLVANPVTLKPKPAARDGLLLANEHANHRSGVRQDMRGSVTSEKRPPGSENAPDTADILVRQSPAVDVVVPQKSRPRQFLDKFAELRRQKGQHKPILIRSGRNMLEYVGSSTSLRESSSPATSLSRPTQEAGSLTGTTQVPTSMQALSQTDGSRGISLLLPDESIPLESEQATTLMPDRTGEEGNGSADEGQDVTMADSHETTI